MNKSVAKLLVAGAMAAVSAYASADVLVDGAPTGTLYGSSWTNQSNGQNFLVQFTLGADSTIDGFSILASSYFGTLGDGTTIRLRADNAGAPALTNLYEFGDTVDSIAAFDGDTRWLTSNFAPISLSAGTYWMGLSFTGNGVWASYNNGGVQNPDYQRQLSGNTIQFAPYIYDLGYQVLGSTAGAVPEPASWALMIGGFALAGGAMRRKAQTALRFA